MKTVVVLIVTLALVAASFAADQPRQTLALRWQPSVSTPDQSCGITDSELQKAVRTLTKSLKKTGMTVQLGKITAGVGSVPGTGLWINNVPLEQWLGAELIAPSDGAVDGCPLIKIGAQTYETIPAELIVKAGLSAAGGKTAALPAVAGSDNLVASACSPASPCCSPTPGCCGQ